MPENYFEIDPDRLDEAWVEHPRIYHEHALALAGAKEVYERAKAELALVEAEVDKDIRLEPERFGGDKDKKPTEKFVENTIILQKEYRKALADMLQAKHEVDIHEVAVSTMEHKKRALEKLVDLQLADYHSPPRAKGASAHKMGEAQADSAFGKRRR